MKYELTRAEIQSGHDRLNFAENLILQLPASHDGRNTWLLNYGRGAEAKTRRTKRGIKWDEVTQAAETIPPRREGWHPSHKPRDRKTVTGQFCTLCGISDYEIDARYNPCTEAEQ